MAAAAEPGGLHEPVLRGGRRDAPGDACAVGQPMGQDRPEDARTNGELREKKVRRNMCVCGCVGMGVCVGVVVGGCVGVRVCVCLCVYGCVYVCMGVCTWGNQYTNTYLPFFIFT